MENIEQQIIACAHRLFVEKGYVNTSMSDIAQEFHRMAFLL